jgi:hypothetical protein
MWRVRWRRLGCGSCATVRPGLAHVQPQGWAVPEPTGARASEGCTQTIMPRLCAWFNAIDTTNCGRVRVPGAPDAGGNLCLRTGSAVARPSRTTGCGHRDPFRTRCSARRRGLRRRSGRLRFPASPPNGELQLRSASHQDANRPALTRSPHRRLSPVVVFGHAANCFLRLPWRGVGQSPQRLVSVLHSASSQASRVAETGSWHTTCGGPRSIAGKSRVAQRPLPWAWEWARGIGWAGEVPAGSCGAFMRLRSHRRTHAGEPSRFQGGPHP